MTRIYVDGSAGTVGLALDEYLRQMKVQGLVDEVVVLPLKEQHNTEARRAAMADTDIVVLCLPDDVARDAAGLALSVNPNVRILDASAAHRCSPGWVYGLPEVVNPADIASARFVANPGCFATACILAAKPLSALLRDKSPTPGAPFMAFQGFAGKSAGGRRMLAKTTMKLPKLTQFGKPHRHLPEIAEYGEVSPMLTTMVGDWYKGLMVQTQVALPAEDVFQAYQAAYADNSNVQVRHADSLFHTVDPQMCNDTNQVFLVVADMQGYSAVAVVLDNLGKGSAGAAAQNLRRMLS